MLQERIRTQKSLYTTSLLNLSSDQKRGEVPFGHQVSNIFGLAHCQVFKGLYRGG